MNIDAGVAAVVYACLDLIGRGKEELLEDWADSFRGDIDSVVSEIRSYPAAFRSPRAGDEAGWRVWQLPDDCCPLPTWDVAARLPQADGGLSDLAVRLEVVDRGDRFEVHFRDVLVE
jgi:hypothetical protein